MVLTKEIEQLFALAASIPGPVTQPKMRDAAAKKKPINAQHPESVAKAMPAAEAIFTWLDGPVGSEIRAEMKESGARLIPLHGWRVCITPAKGMLHTRRENNPQMGNFDNTRIDVETPDELIKAVGPEIVCSVHEAIVNDHVFTQMSAHLRQLSGGNKG